MTIPLCSSVHASAGTFTLSPVTTLWHPADDAGARRAARRWQANLTAPTGFSLSITTDASGPGPGAISLRTDAGASTDGPGAEAYRLRVRPDGVTVTGGASGLLHAGQTFRQLLPAEIYRAAPIATRDWLVACVDIEDRPRFAWRGVMLDVARHFMPKHDVLRFIDLMAIHKFNRLHLHLTDDQGWRVEIVRYPRLTSVASHRRESQLGAAPDAPGDNRPHGGYYTQADLREIVAFAAERGITVVPEIEFPGHVLALLAAYPEFGVTGQPLEVGTRWGISPHVLNSDEDTLRFLRDVFDELMQIFPSDVVGIGGDECPRDQWMADPKTRKLMAQRKIADGAGLQAWFLSRISGYLAEHGRHVMGWDEMLESSVPDDAVVLGWRGDAGIIRAARRGLTTIACPDDRAYLDYRQSYDPHEPIPFAVPLTLRDVYEFDPVPSQLTEQESELVLGGQANVWTEHMDSARVVDYYVYPRLCAMSESLWTTKELKDYDDFCDRLTGHVDRLNTLGVEYRHERGPLPWQQRPGIPGKTSTPAAHEKHIRQLTASLR